MLHVTDCEDDNDYCAAWANIGECEANPNYMLYNCRLSCGVCQLEANCRGGDGTSYRGTVSVTKTGKTCQRWDSQTPHEHQYTAADYPSGGLEQNYCRNPDGWVEVWCYTTDPDTRYEGCDIPACGADWLERSPDWPIDATQTPWPDAAGPHKVLDGNYYSHWNPGGRGPWYIIFDLVVRYTLSKFSITNCGDTTHDISTFQLQASASSDPYNWEDVVTVTDVATTSEIQEFGGFSATGRFWKLNITKTHGTWQPWLREVNFLGERAGRLILVQLHFGGRPNILYRKGPLKPRTAEFALHRLVGINDTCSIQHDVDYLLPTCRLPTRVLHKP
ncbi:uncharacterized protein [Branchiostoma lanceolatum]|uniref:uncharacterized protein n=1 Tax=Branchiostoma lanceolatum TaxID=7740 RepID=UPI00345372D4